MPDAKPSGKPYFVVLNPASGSDQSSRARDTITRVIEAAGQRVEFLEFRDASAIPATARLAAERALAEDGTVVACGGDGTINGVAAAALDAGVPLGVIPQGTFNYFGRAFGIPADVEQAVTLMLQSAPRLVQVGLINQRPFLVSASIGLYPQVLEDRETWKLSLGRHRLVAIAAAIFTLMRKHTMLALMVDDGKARQQLRSTTLVVCNNPIQLARLGIEGAAQAGVSRLVAISLAPIGKLGWLRLIVKGALGTLGDAEEVTATSCTHLTAALERGYFRRRIRVAIDGEIVRLRLPLTFEVSPKPLQLRAAAAASAAADPG